MVAGLFELSHLVALQARRGDAPERVGTVQILELLPARAAQLARPHRCQREQAQREFRAGARALGLAIDQQLPRSAQPFVILLRSEEHTSELQSLMRISYAVFCLKNKTPSPLILQVHLYHTTSG